MAAGFAILVPAVTKGGSVVTPPSLPVLSLPPPSLPPPALVADVPSCVLDVSEMYGLYVANPGT